MWGEIMCTGRGAYLYSNGPMDRIPGIISTSKMAGSNYQEGWRRRSAFRWHNAERGSGIVGAEQREDALP